MLPTETQGLHLQTGPQPFQTPRQPVKLLLTLHRGYLEPSTPSTNPSQWPSVCPQQMTLP